MMLTAWPTEPQLVETPVTVATQVTPLAMPVKMVMQRLPETPMAETVDIAGAVSADSNPATDSDSEGGVRQLAVTQQRRNRKCRRRRRKRKAMAGTAAMPDGAR
jgi:hypothetical protein